MIRAKYRRSATAEQTRPRIAIDASASADGISLGRSETAEGTEHERAERKGRSDRAQRLEVGQLPLHDERSAGVAAGRGQDGEGTHKLGRAAEEVDANDEHDADDPHGESDQTAAGRLFDQIETYREHHHDDR